MAPERSHDFNRLADGIDVHFLDELMKLSLVDSESPSYRRELKIFRAGVLLGIRAMNDPEEQEQIWEIFREAKIEH